MGLLESFWFIIAFLIIGIVLLVDPKNSAPSSGTNSMLQSFSSPSEGQQFIYRSSAVLIASFYISTTALNFTKIVKIPKTNAKSPILFRTIAFIAALLA